MLVTIRIARLPRITRFGPKRSSSQPPASAPAVPVTVSRMPNTPMAIVPQPKVPAA